MPHMTVGRENSGDIVVYYEDHGSGQPVLLGHGYPFDRQAWEKQVPALLASGHRVIAYDHRGWGRSSQPAVGYDFETGAHDVHALVESLDLRDLVLIAHSTGTGDFTRYVGLHGGDRVARAVLIAPLPPGLTPDTEPSTGSRRSGFSDYLVAARADRLAWLAAFLDDAYNMDAYGGTLVSNQAFQASFNVAASGSSVAAVDSITSWRTDFHTDLPSLDMPVLVVHGDQDRFLPLEATSQRLTPLLHDVTSVVIEGGPNAVMWTHPDQVNRALHDFLA